MSRPTLSLVLCSRNDDYMGNSRWRLETALNYVAAELQTIGRDADVEIVVTDWGSQAPLCDAVRLTPAAARLTSFVVVPPDTAKALQRDSPFAEVIALNAAVRRARGDYIGRIDQDTLVGRRFLAAFFALVDGRSARDAPLQMGFSNIRMIPYRFAVRCPPAGSVALFVRWFGRRIRRENWRSRAPYYHAAVGIWLLHRDVWADCGGYDERMIYMNSMETNMTRRLMPKYAMVNLGEHCDWDFYHLEHYHPWVPRVSRVYRKTNTDRRFAQPDALNPNGDGWGLRDLPLEVRPAIAGPTAAPPGAVVAVARFLVLLLSIAPALATDAVGLAARHQWHRARRLRDLVRGRPVTAWPALVRARLKERQNRA